MANTTFFITTNRHLLSRLSVRSGWRAGSEDRATPEQVEEYERQVDGEDERTAIFKAAAENGIHFRPETPPSDYSPTGRCYFTRPQIQTAGPLVIVYQSSAIDN